MTLDTVALCRDRPEIETVLASLQAAGPALRVLPLPRGRLVQLCDDAGAPLLTIEGPTLVQLPSEVHRLLGVTVTGPVWWVEARARDADGYGIARRLIEALAAATRGQTWPDR